VAQEQIDRIQMQLEAIGTTPSFVLPLANATAFLEGLSCPICKGQYKRKFFPFVHLFLTWIFSGVMTKPMASSCCEALIGCKECVERWFTEHTDQVSCPRCRNGDAELLSFELKGLDDVLAAIAPLARLANF
jgi:hypothetical protein